MDNLILPRIPSVPMYIGEVMTREWQGFFRNLMVRVGGYSAPSIDEEQIATAIGTYDTTRDYTSLIRDTAMQLLAIPSPKSYDNELRDLALGILSLPSPRDYSREIDELRIKIECIGSCPHNDTIESLIKYWVLIGELSSVVHNNTSGLNEGDYIHLTATEKVLFDTLSFSGGNLGPVVSKTISVGDIDLTPSQHLIALTGEGDIADVLVSISKTSGGELDAGHEVVLKGKVGLAYMITITDGGNLHLQANFGIDSEYDSITLVSIGDGHFIEKGGRADNT